MLKPTGKTIAAILKQTIALNPSQRAVFITLYLKHEATIQLIVSVMSIIQVRIANKAIDQAKLNTECRKHSSL